MARIGQDMTQAKNLPSLAVAAVLSLAAGAALAEQRPTLNFSGVPGLIDMPSGEALDDGNFAVSYAFFGNVRRNTLTFQITPRLTGSFRYTTFDGWDDVVPNGQDPYIDRSFDLRFLLVEEGTYLPSVTIGLQDFIGTGINSAEYIAATKNVGDRLKVTAGLGWGRLGSYGGIGSPFGARPPIDQGEGGVPSVNQWFRGPVAPFGGVEYRIGDNWTLKAEYSSDDYTEIAGRRQVFDRRSPFNFGLEYSRNPAFRAGVYSLYGSEIGLSFQIILDPKNRLSGGLLGNAPVAVGIRPSRSSDPDAYDGGWVTQPDAGPLLQANLIKRLERDGILLEGLSYTSTTATLRIRSTSIDSGAQAIGRALRALSHVMPASVEEFRIVPVVNGIGVSKVIVRRSDLESLEHAPGNDALLAQRIRVEDAGPVPAGEFVNPDLLPRLTWGVLPAVRVGEAGRFDIGLRLQARYEIRPGLILHGQFHKVIAGDLDKRAPRYDSVLPPVRTHAQDYIRFGDPAVERLTLAWYARPGRNLYSRVTLGYLERMHGGVSGELLWKPVDSRLALGVEVNYTRQRDTDGFGFSQYDYGVTTGHLSAYYDFGRGYVGQVDVGRYLAGDVGATLSLDREFANGWRVGAFATLTDVSPEDFGEGSFDKGIRVTVPMNWLLGTQTQAEISRTIRPILRDGGARLDVAGRLYDSIRDYHSGRLDSEWGRVWR